MLDEIKERLDKITPGEWWENFAGIYTDYGGGKMIATTFEDHIQDYDAQFIAHAPQDIKWLIEQLEKEIENSDTSDHSEGEMYRYCQQLKTELDAKDKEIEVLNERYCEDFGCPNRIDPERKG